MTFLNQVSYHYDAGVLGRGLGVVPTSTSSPLRPTKPACKWDDPKGDPNSVMNIFTRNYRPREKGIYGNWSFLSFMQKSEI